MKPSGSGAKYIKEPPMQMRTVRDFPWDCPWCRKHVAAGEVHDDRAQDRFDRQPKDDGHESLVITRGRMAS